MNGSCQQSQEDSLHDLQAQQQRPLPAPPVAQLQKPGEEDGGQNQKGSQDLKEGDEHAAARTGLHLDCTALGGLGSRRLAALRQRGNPVILVSKERNAN